MSRIQPDAGHRAFEALRKAADETGVSLVTLSVAWVLDADLKRQLDDLTHEYRLGDAPR